MAYLYCERETAAFIAPDTSGKFFLLRAGERKEIDDLLPNDNEPEWLVYLENKTPRFVRAEIVKFRKPVSGLADLRGLLLKLAIWAGQYGFKA